MRPERFPVCAVLVAMTITASLACTAEPFEAVAAETHVIRSESLTPETLDGQLRVVSWNVKGSRSGADPRHIDDLAEVIRQLDPDVVMLQEVHRRTRASAEKDQFQELAGQLGMSGCFGESLAVDEGSYGNAILLSGRVEKSRMFLLPGRGEPRTILECVGGWADIEVPIMTTHLTAWDRANRRKRALQVRTIEEIIGEIESPLLILGGDFNASIQAPEMTALADHPWLEPVLSSYVITHGATGRSYDHIFVGDGWKVEEAVVVRTGPSDHWPVRTDLSWESER